MLERLAAFALIVLGLALVVGLDVGGARTFMPGLLEGAVVTVQVTVLGALVAFPAALLGAFGKMSGIAPLRWLAVSYIELFRGTSALVQLFWLYFVLPHFGVSIDAVTAAVAALGLNIGAYGAEVVRGAIAAVPRGQWEAATALNMGHGLAMRRIVLPQAFVAMLPPWGNLLIELLKATALVSLITLSDIAFRAQQMNQVTLATTEIFTLVLLLYLAIALLISAGIRWLERIFGRGLSRGRA